MTILGDRIRERRKLLGLNQTAFGTLVGLDQNTISDLERGKTLETTKLHEIAQACGVSADWLIGRTDDPKGGPPTRGNVISLRSSNQTESRTLPEIDVRGGASYGGGMMDEPWQDGDKSGDKPVAQWGLPSAFVERELGLSFGMADIIMVYGDSMDDGTAHGFASGDRVIIDRKHTDPRQGGVFAVFDGEGVIIKQVELVRGHNPPRIICKSRNPSYDPIHLVLESPVSIIGRVAGRISRV